MKITRNFILEQSRRDNTHEVQITPHKRSAVWGLHANMKHSITLLLLLVTFTVAAQSYSPCYTDFMAKGNTAYNQGKYSEAKTYYAKAKQCAGGNPTEAQKKISACEAKIKAQQDEAEAKRKAEQEAAEAKRKAEQETAEVKRKAEQEAAEAKRKAEQEAAEAKRKAEQEAAEVKRKAEATATARQRAIDEAKSRGYEYITVNGVTFKMVYVQGGTFTMGCTSEQGGACYGDEKPSHQVTLSDYWIGETEVTQALWEAVMGSNPSRFKGDNRPVENVSWDDCQEFIRKLNALTGKTFALPTEAQWEYAARGGNKSRHNKYAGSNSIGDVAWYTDNSGSSTHPVRGKQANELGLYDMSGNVWEWCEDWYGSYSSSSQTNPTGPSSGSSRVDRGGSWRSYARDCRVSRRDSLTPAGTPFNRDVNLGFRLSLVR